jgi:UDP-glucose 4-epimerase
MRVAQRTAPNDIGLEALAGRNVLVTGGLGFIGSNLAIALAGAGARVTIVDALVEGCGGNIGNISDFEGNIAVEISDLRSLQRLPALVSGKDYIFHLAGQVSHAGSMLDPLLDLDINCTATVHLAEACRQHNPAARLVFTSTRQVYGRPMVLPVHEDHPTLPIDVNGINKLAAERYLLVYHKVHGLRVTVLRLTNTYGPRQKLGNAHLGVAGLFIQQALSHQTICLYDGHQLRDFVHVDDVTAALLLAAVQDRCSGGIFNLGAAQPHTLAQFAQALQRLCPCDIRHVPFPPACRAIEIGDYHADWSRFHRATGWEPRIALDAGLEQTIRFCRARMRAGAENRLRPGPAAELLSARRWASGVIRDE